MTNDERNPNDEIRILGALASLSARRGLRSLIAGRMPALPGFVIRHSSFP